MTRKLAVALSPDQLRSMLRTMRMIRQFDLRALDLYREGAMRGSTVARSASGSSWISFNM